MVDLIVKCKIQKLIDNRVLIYLSSTIKRIEEISYFLKKNKIKLVIVSVSVHEEDLVLLVAAKICKIKTLLVGHGLTGCKNQFLDNYIDYQATFSPFEYRHKAAEHFELLSEWFN